MKHNYSVVYVFDLIRDGKREEFRRYTNLSQLQQSFLFWEQRNKKIDQIMAIERATPLDSIQSPRELLYTFELDSNDTVEVFRLIIDTNTNNTKPIQK